MGLSELCKPDGAATTLQLHVAQVQVSNAARSHSVRGLWSDADAFTRCHSTLFRLDDRNVILPCRHNLWAWCGPLRSPSRKSCKVVSFVQFTSMWLLDILLSSIFRAGLLSPREYRRTLSYRECNEPALSLMEPALYVICQRGIDTCQRFSDEFDILDLRYTPS